MRADKRPLNIGASHGQPSRVLKQALRIEAQHLGDNNMKTVIRSLTVCSVMFVLGSSFVISDALAQRASETIHELDFKRGDRQLELTAGTLETRRNGRQGEAAIGVEFGMTDHWSTQLSAEYKRDPGSGTGFNAVEWQNKFKLTASGNLPVDIGFLTEIDRPRDRSEGYQVRFGPLFQKDIGDVLLNLNLWFERRFRATPPRPTEMGYQWQAKYRWRPALQFGLQGFGEMGEWDDPAPRSEQSHRFGPAVFGKVSLSGGQDLKYDAAYLTDPSSRASSHGFQMRLQYGF